MKELTTEPQPCIACLGAKRSSEDRGVDRGQPGDAGGLNAETNRAGTLCDHCGGTGLDPESLLGDWSDYARAAVRWLMFEAPGDWSRDRCLQHIRAVWGDLTVLEIRFRTARERVVKDSESSHIPAIPTCPFCGGTNIRFTNHGKISREMGHRNDDVWSTCCHDCGATFPNRYNKQALIDCWNLRPAGHQHFGKKIANSSVAGRALSFEGLAYGGTSENREFPKNIQEDALSEVRREWFSRPRRKFSIQFAAVIHSSDAEEIANHLEYLASRMRESGGTAGSGGGRNMTAAWATND